MQLWEFLFKRNSFFLFASQIVGTKKKEQIYFIGFASPPAPLGWKFG